MIDITLAIIVAIVSICDIRHLFQVARVVAGYRLPLYMLSTVGVLLRIPAIWWAYLNNHSWLTLVAAGFGSTAIMLAYRVDLVAMRKAIEVAAKRTSDKNFL